MILEEIYFVNVEDAAIGPREQTRPEHVLPSLNKCLNIKRPGHHFLCDTKRQVNDRYLLANTRQLSFSFEASAAIRAQVFRWPMRVTIVRTTLHNFNFRKNLRQTPDCRRLSRALVPRKEYAADLRVNHVQEQAELHVVLPLDARKRKVI